MINLYKITPVNDDWCCYVFAETMRKAKLLAIRRFCTFDDEWVSDFKSKTIKKNTGGEVEFCDVDCERLAVLGVKYAGEDD